MAQAALAIDGGDLSLGGGLLALLRPSLQLLEPGGVLVVLSSCPSNADDLPSWCRAEAHTYLGSEPTAAGVRHLLARGTLSVPRRAPDEKALPAGEAPTSAAVLLAAPMPEHAHPSSGFAPRGSAVEPGGPAYPFTLLERDALAPLDVAQLYDQACASQWSAVKDIPWNTHRALEPALERAVAQLMTFLAENELSALYVPSRFLSQIHPAYVEVAMFLATQLTDESRHLDVFLKRARLGGGRLGVSSATTSRSLHSLLMQSDFTEASFLLGVLGEGTFLDLLRFIETHAPDEVTAEICRRARVDEARHVHFAMSHVRQALAHDHGLYARLQAAVERRALTMGSQTSVPAPIQDALTVLAAGGTAPRQIARGHDEFRVLLDEMHHGRLKRLQSAGFTLAQSEALSMMHTPNFM